MMNSNEKRDPCDDERDTKNQIEKKCCNYFSLEDNSIFRSMFAI